MTLVVLSVAGSDSGGGAGIQADLATLQALGLHGTCAITALTAQNTLGISGVHPVPPAFVGEQIRQVWADMAVSATKTGMLHSPETVQVVAQALAAAGVANLVVDPVLVATSGSRLLAPAGERALLECLFPLATVITPNLAEAAVLTGREVADLPGMREAARALHDAGPAWVLLTGGHLEGAPVDLLFDGSVFTELSGPRVDTPHAHGTGCVLSAALAGLLALGAPVPDAAAAAKELVATGLRHARRIGHGPGCVDPAPGGYETLRRWRAGGSM